MKQPKVKNSSIDILPNELIMEVFFFLQIKDLFSLSMINNRFYNVSQNSSLWKKICHDIMLRPVHFKTKDYPIAFPEKEHEKEVENVLDHLFRSLNSCWKSVCKSFYDRFKKEWLFMAPWTRLAYNFETKSKINKKFPISHSKIGGENPLLLESEEWPTCKTCKKKMMFVFQINTSKNDPGSALIHTYGENKLIQFFVCDNYKEEIYNNYTSEGFFLTRVLDFDSSMKKYKKNIKRKDLSRSSLPFKVITKLEPFLDYPEEYFSLSFKKAITHYLNMGSCIYNDTKEVRKRISEFEEKVIDKNDRSRKRICKVAGWPKYWCGIEPEKCEKCKTQMKLVFYFEEDTLIPFEWDCDGNAHLSYCRECNSPIITFVFCNAG